MKAERVGTLDTLDANVVTMTSKRIATQMNFTPNTRHRHPELSVSQCDTG
jgi:hypothetical protein